MHAFQFQVQFQNRSTMLCPRVGQAVRATGLVRLQARHIITPATPGSSVHATRTGVSMFHAFPRMASGPRAVTSIHAFLLPTLKQQCACLGTATSALARVRTARNRNAKAEETVAPTTSTQSQYLKSKDDEDNSLDARLDRSQLATLDDKPTQKYVAKVFREAGSTVGVATAAAVGSMVTGLMVSPFIPMLAGLVPLFMFYQTAPGTHSTAYRYGLVGTFAALQGMSIAPLVSVALAVNPMLIPMALGGTVLVFGGASLAALLAPRQSMLRFGTILGGASAVLFGFSLLAIGQYTFMGAVSPIFFNFTLYGGLALMCAFVGYDTHRIIEDYKENSPDPLRHGMDVFVNFIGIFRRLLYILLMRDE
eukprot:m.10290 g.10290  ORF g.10290 m.10290 type:complete len:365 (+) comp4298_c0_seq1:22-1116(+)